MGVYDVQQPTHHEGGGVIAKHKNVFVVDKQHRQGHKYAVSSAVWYPIDTGLFITGSYDHYVKVWDTNATQVYQILVCLSYCVLYYSISCFFFFFHFLILIL